MDRAQGPDASGLREEPELVRASPPLLACPGPSRRNGDSGRRELPGRRVREEARLPGFGVRVPQEHLVRTEAELAWTGEDHGEGGMGIRLLGGEDPQAAVHAGKGSLLAAKEPQGRRLWLAHTRLRRPGDGGVRSRAGAKV